MKLQIRLRLLQIVGWGLGRGDGNVNLGKVEERNAPRLILSCEALCRFARSSAAKIAVRSPFLRESIPPLPVLDSSQPVTVPGLAANSTVVNKAPLIVPETEAGPRCRIGNFSVENGRRCLGRFVTPQNVPFTLLV